MMLMHARNLQQTSKVQSANSGHPDRWRIKWCVLCYRFIDTFQLSLMCSCVSVADLSTILFNRLVNVDVLSIADTLSPILFDYRWSYRRYFWKRYRWGIACTFLGFEMSVKITDTFGLRVNSVYWTRWVGNVRILWTGCGAQTDVSSATSTCVALQGSNALMTYWTSWWELL